MAMTQQCALRAQKANYVLIHQRSVASWSRKVIIKLHSALVASLLECCVQLRCLERVLKKITKMVRSLGHLSYGEKLRDMGLFSLEKKRLQGDFRAALRYLKSAYKKDTERFFSFTKA